MEINLRVLVQNMTKIFAFFRTLHLEVKTKTINFTLIGAVFCHSMCEIIFCFLIITIKYIHRKPIMKCYVCK